MPKQLREGPLAHSKQAFVATVDGIAAYELDVASWKRNQGRWAAKHPDSNPDDYHDVYRYPIKPGGFIHEMDWLVGQTMGWTLCGQCQTHHSWEETDRRHADEVVPHENEIESRRRWNEWDEPADGGLKLRQIDSGRKNLIGMNRPYNRKDRLLGKFWKLPTGKDNEVTVDQAFLGWYTRHGVEPPAGFTFREFCQRLTDLPEGLFERPVQEVAPLAMEEDDNDAGGFAGDTQEQETLVGTRSTCSPSLSPAELFALYPPGPFNPAAMFPLGVKHTYPRLGFMMPEADEYDEEQDLAERKQLLERGASNTTILNLRRDVERVQMQCNSANQRGLALQTELHTIRQAAETEIQRLQNIVTQLQSQCRSTNEGKLAVENDLSSVRKAREDLAEDHNELLFVVCAINEELVAMREAKTIGDKASGVLQTNLDHVTAEKTTLRTQYDELVEEKSTLQAKYDEVIQEKTSLQTQYNDLVNKQSALQTSYDDSARDKSSLQTRYNDLIKEKTTQYNESVTDLSTLQTRYNGLAQEKSAIQTRYDDSLKEKTTLERQVDTLDTDNKQLQKTAVTRTTLIEELSVDNTLLQQTAADHSSLLTWLATDQARDEQRQREALQSAHQEVARQTEEITGLSARCQRVDRVNRGWADELVDREVEKEAMMLEIKTLEWDKRGLQERMDKALAQADADWMELFREGESARVGFELELRARWREVESASSAVQQGERVIQGLERRLWQTQLDLVQIQGEHELQLNIMQSTCNDRVQAFRVAHENDVELHAAREQGLEIQVETLEIELEILQGVIEDWDIRLDLSEALGIGHINTINWLQQELQTAKDKATADATTIAKLETESCRALKDLQAVVDELKADATKRSKTVEELGTSGKNNAHTIATLETKVAELSKSLKGSQTTVEGLNREAKAASDKIDKLEADARASTGQLSKLQDDATKASTEAQAIVNRLQREANAANDKIIALETKVGDSDRKISTLEQKASSVQRADRDWAAKEALLEKQHAAGRKLLNEQEEDRRSMAALQGRLDESIRNAQMMSTLLLAKNEPGQTRSLDDTRLIGQLEGKLSGMEAQLVRAESKAGLLQRQLKEKALHLEQARAQVQEEVEAREGVQRELTRTARDLQTLTAREARATENPFVTDEEPQELFGRLAISMRQVREGLVQDNEGLVRVMGAILRKRDSFTGNKRIEVVQRVVTWTRHLVAEGGGKDALWDLFLLAEELDVLYT